MDDPSQIAKAIIKIGKLNINDKLGLKRIFENQFKLDTYLNRFEKIIKELKE